MSPDQMPHAFGLLNGILPVAGLMALAVLLPMPLLRWVGTRQTRLSLVMIGTGLAILLIGAALLAALTISQNAVATENPFTYIARSTLMALGWGPIWALVWLVRAQGVEKRKGLMMERREMMHEAARRGGRHDGRP